MDKDRDRWLRCTRKLREKGYAYERFPGIDISKVDTRPYRLKNLTNGQVGCTLSHRAIWKKMLREGAPWVIVAEDDVVPECDAQVMEHVIQQMPKETDVLHFGCTWFCSRTKSAYRGFSHLERFFGTHCYLITNKGARKYFARWKNDLSLPIDVQMTKMDLITYEPKVPVATHELMTGCGSTIARGRGPLCVFDRIEFKNKRTLGFYLMYPCFRTGVSVAHIIYCLCFLLFSFFLWKRLTHSSVLPGPKTRAI